MSLSSKRGHSAPPYLPNVISCIQARLRGHKLDSTSGASKQLGGAESKGGPTLEEGLERHRAEATKLGGHKLEVERVKRDHGVRLEAQEERGDLRPPSSTQGGTSAQQVGSNRVPFWQ